MTHDKRQRTTTIKGKGLLPLAQAGALMCATCGHRGDEPRDHYGIGTVVCPAGRLGWITYRPPVWMRSLPSSRGSEP